MRYTKNIGGLEGHGVNLCDVALEIYTRLNQSMEIRRYLSISDID